MSPPPSPSVAAPLTGTVVRTITLLSRIAEADGDISVNQLSEQVSLPTSTVHRLLQLLHQTGFVSYDRANRLYGIGPELFRLASVVAGKRRIDAIAMPLIERVVRECNEACLLGLYLPNAHAMSFVAQVRSPHALGFEIAANVELPLVWGASGLAILAFLPENEFEAALVTAGPSPASGDPLPGRGELHKTLEQVRKRGYAASRGQKVAHAVGIAAPVFDRESHVVGSLTVTIPAIRFRRSDKGPLGELTMRAAAELSASLGYGRHLAHPTGS